MTYLDPCEEIMDMSGYDLDGPVKYTEEDYKKARQTQIKNIKKRRCVNRPECNWEGMLEEWVRLCPGCGMEIKGWKSAYIEDSPKPG